MTAEAIVETPAEAIARSLPVTQWAVDVLSPHEWMRLADYLTGLLTRRPLMDGQGYWQSFRIVIGALASELRQNALDAGEPAEVVEDPTPEWIAWEKRMDHEYALATDPMLHRPISASLQHPPAPAPVDTPA